MLSRRSTAFTDPLWEQVPLVYRTEMYTMMGGGVRDSSHTTYTKGFLEFWRTMYRMGFDDDLVFGFPLKDAVLQMYIINCSRIRDPPNCYNTIRNKLRAIDYIAQLSGVYQSWSENPSLDSIIKYCKKRNKSKGSDSLPITADMCLCIVRHVLNAKVYVDLVLNKAQRAMANQWLTFPAVRESPKRLKWYMWAIAFLLLCVLGIRGADCYENEQKMYADYGLQLDDVTAYFVMPASRTLYTTNDEVTDTTNLHHIRFRLRNSKTACPGENKWLRLGRTHRKIDPALCVFHVYQIQQRELRRLYPIAKGPVYLFHAGASKGTMQQCKIMLKQIAFEMHFLEPDRIRMHGTRKGFATTLLQKGVPMSLIAFAGLWKLQSAIYCYLVHSQKDLLKIVSLYLYGETLNLEQIDMDEREFRVVAELDVEPGTLRKGFFFRTRGLTKARL